MCTQMCVFSLGQERETDMGGMLKSTITSVIMYCLHLSFSSASIYIAPKEQHFQLQEYTLM